MVFKGLFFLRQLTMAATFSSTAWIQALLYCAACVISYRKFTIWR